MADHLILHATDRNRTGLPPPPTKQPGSYSGSCVEKNLINRRNGYLAPIRSSSSSQGTNRVSSGLVGSRSGRGHRYQLMGAMADIRLRVRPQANKEIVRRALAPPCRRPSMRWWNFRPTPSRLSNMSVAEV